MKELDKTKVYSLEDLTSEERNEVDNYIKIIQPEYNTITVDEYSILEYKKYNEWCYWHKENSIKYNYQTTNAKELFYTLENVQVDCSELTQEEVNNIIDIYELNDIKFAKRDFKGTNTSYSLIMSFNNIPNEYTTITYSKFMELFGSITTDSIQPHYDNTNGSIYKFCNDQKLNAWEFDIIKRVVRCRKKGLFKEDLQKTKDLIDLYLKEFTDEK